MSTFSGFKSPRATKSPSIVNYIPRSQKHQRISTDLSQKLFKQSSASSHLSQKQQILLLENLNLKTQNNFLLNKLRQATDYKQHHAEVTKISQKIIQQLQCQNKDLKIQISELIDINKIALKNMQFKIGEVVTSNIEYERNKEYYDKENRNPQQNNSNLEILKLDKDFKYLYRKQRSELSRDERRFIRGKMLQLVKSMSKTRNR